MKKLILTIMIMALAMSNASAWNLKDALKGLGGADSTATTSGLGAVLGNLLSSDKLTVAQLEGTWTYVAPAVAFKSDNVLKKAGGAAASSAVEAKLAPIFQRTGFDKSQLTVNADSSFVLKGSKITLKGTISELTEEEAKNSQANFVFNFSVGGKIKLGQAEAYITKSATGNLSLTFDVTKLISLMETAGNLTGNSTINSAVKLLKSYDGLCAGFEMKQTEAPKSK